MKNECILDSAQRITPEGHKFKSSISEAQHFCLNQRLNRKVDERAATYLHSVEIDKYYNNSSSIINSNGSSAPGFPGKLRSSFDGLSRKYLNKTIVKQRIADLEWWCPNADADVRISINVEQTSKNSLFSYLTCKSD